MYGVEGASGGSALAATGLATGSWILMGVGIIFVGLALIALIRRPGKNRP